jgi:hypothetical protein
MSFWDELELPEPEPAKPTPAGLAAVLDRINPPQPEPWGGRRQSEWAKMAAQTSVGSGGRPPSPNDDEAFFEALKAAKPSTSLGG